MTAAADDIVDLLLAIHWQTWRSDAPLPVLSLEDLIAAMPILIESGSIGLVWPRLRAQAGQHGAIITVGLEKAYEMQAQYNARVELEIARIVSRLHESGIEPVLVKGWSMGRHYPAPLIRTAGDIDLIVPTQEHDWAYELLFGDDAFELQIDVDLKHENTWEEIPNTDFWSRTNEIIVGGVRVRVLGPEDELRMLCFHLLKHGGQRPIWMCDVAAALENRSQEFDWDLLLGPDSVERGWVTAALGLARQFVGADTDSTPVAREVTNLPRWLTRGVIEQWHSPTTIVFAEAITTLRANPGGVIGILRERWPNPLIATIFYHAPINNWPRLPWQCMTYAKRIGVHVRSRMLTQIRMSTTIERAAH